MGDGISADEFSRAVNDLRSLMIQLDQARQEASKMRHATLGDTLQRIMNEQALVRAELAAHAADDEKVATRVTVLEEAQKRVTWVTLVGIPSAIAGWEGLKRFIGGR